MIEQNCHAACIVDLDGSGFSAIYSRIHQYLLKGYAVAYVAEDNTATAIQNIKNSGVDVDHFLPTGALQVIDRDLYYNPNKELEPQKLLDQFSKIVTQVDFQKFKGMLGIGSAGPAFFQIGKLEPLLEYEHKIGKRFKVPVEIICCYRSNDIRQLEFSHLVSVITSHAYVITSEGTEHKGLNSDAIISFIAAGINKSLCANISDIILKTLEIAYGIKKERIISQPRIFKNALEKALGITSSRIVLAEIENEIRCALLGDNKT